MTEETVNAVFLADRGRAGNERYILPTAELPYRDESLPGLILRNAEAYKFHNPMRLFRRIRPRRQKVWALSLENPVSKDGQGMQALLGLSDEQMARLSLWTGDETLLSILGHRVWRDLIRHESRAVCSLCLKDSTHHRAVWLLDMLPVCAVHGVWLVDRCPAPGCRRPLTWSGHGVHYCGSRLCRHDLRDAPVQQADPAALGGTRALHRLLHGEPSGSPTALAMPVGEALRLSFVLGQRAFGFERATRPHGFIRRELRQIPEVVDSGWNALDDWPNGFHALMEGLRTRASERRGTDGLRKAFGSLSRRVYDWAREPWGAPIGVAFAEYAGAQGDLGTAANTLRRYAPGADLRHRHMSLTDASRALGIGPVTMVTLARKRGMFVLEPRGGGIPSQLRADVVRQLQEELGDFALPEEVRSMLGVGRPVMEQLEEAGLIRRVPQDERVMTSRPYRKSEIRAFVDACIGRAESMSRSAAHDNGLTRVTRLGAVGHSVPHLCRALLDGRLKSAATVSGERGLMRIRLRLAEVDEALPTGHETLSLLDVEKITGVDYQHFNYWALRGLLQTTGPKRPGERGKRVTQEALNVFRRDFLMGGELAKMFGQEKNYWLSRHLKFQNVVPVSGPGVDKGKLLLFRRQDCTPAVMAAVRRVQAGPPGTPQDKHRLSFARARLAAEMVATRWGTSFERVNNRFVDRAGGRTLQVMSGRRPDLTGVFLFQVNNVSLERLRVSPEPWIALVPAQGDQFILAPFGCIPWRSQSLSAGYVVVRFDVTGQPLELAEWAVPLPVVGDTP